MRNGILVVVFLLAWIYLYVPNTVLSFLESSNQSQAISDDLVFLWIPAFLGIAAYVAHAGRWGIRFALSVSPPIVLLAVIYLLGLSGAMSKEDAGWSVMLLMFPMRAFVIALAATTAVVETVKRFRANRDSNERPAT
jgi:hypothetical protein